MNNTSRNSKTVSRTVFIGSVITLLIISFGAGSIEYYQVNDLQSTNSKLQTDYQNLQTSYNQLQTMYNQLQSSNNSQLQSNSNNLQSQFDQLNSKFQQLQSTYNLSQTQTANLQSQIISLQSQLSNETTLIAQLQGPTGILPVYLDLAYVGVTIYNGYYLLQLSLKNTGTVPITQIFVTLKSVQITMPFAYLNTTVTANEPLPPYQTAAGSQNVSPPIISDGTYSLVIQASATNGTIYTYQTTIASHK